jgi:hypothetical protein
MILTEVQVDPPILDIEIPELSIFDFETYFSLPSERREYGNLSVEEGRVNVTFYHPLYEQLKRVMVGPIYQITKKLLEMDTKNRYPLSFSKDFDQFYKREVLKRDRAHVLGTIDHAGFNQPWHLDNRFVMLSGSINVQDNDTTTRFAWEESHWDHGGTNFDDCTIIHHGRNTKFSGTAWLNTERTWHCVPKVTEDARKTILFNVFL